MIFQVNFKLPNENCLHVHGLTDSLGMNLLSEIRQEIGAKVPAKQITVKHYCPSFNNGTFPIYLTDKQLDQVEHLQLFNAREIIDVIVPDGFLGRYWKMYITKGIVSSDYTFIQSMIKSQRMVRTYEVNFELDSDEVFNDWIDAGCPQTWEDSRKLKIDDVDQDYRFMAISRHKQNGSLKYFEEEGHDFNLVGTKIRDIVLTSKVFIKDYPSDNVCSILRIVDIPAIINILITKLNPKGVRQLITLCEERLKELERNSDEK